MALSFAGWPAQLGSRRSSPTSPPALRLLNERPPTLLPNESALSGPHLRAKETKRPGRADPVQFHPFLVDPLPEQTGFG